MMSSNLSLIFISVLQKQLIIPHICKKDELANETFHQTAIKSRILFN